MEYVTIAHASGISPRSTAIQSTKKWLLKMNHAKAACSEKQSKLWKCFVVSIENMFFFSKSKAIYNVIALGIDH